MPMGAALLPWYHHGLRERSLQDRRTEPDPEGVALSAHGGTMGPRQTPSKISRGESSRLDDPNTKRSFWAHEPSCFEDSTRPSAIARGKRRLKTCGYQNKRFWPCYEVSSSAARSISTDRATYSGLPLAEREGNVVPNSSAQACAARKPDASAPSIEPRSR